MSYCLGAFIFLTLLISAPALGQEPSDQEPAPLYDKGINALLGSKVNRDNLHAVEYVHRAAELGYAPAQVTLGSLYQTGTIVAREPHKAFDWYKKAAEQDDPLAEWLAGSLILSGEVGVRDLNEAAAWFQKSAQHGDPFGQYLLGLVKLERKDFGAAIEWLRKAASQGLPQAQQQVGMLLREGRGGVQENRFEAYVWLLLSFQNGNRSATNDLQELEADLGTKQVEQAKNKAREMATRSELAHGCTGWSGELQTIPGPPPVEIQRYCRE